jgi:hypothetical protein
VQVRSNDAASCYYELTPPASHGTGDIWQGLPCFGLSGTGVCAAVVITPACDLAWSKSATLTFLPIRTLAQCICDGVFLPDLRSSVNAGLDSLGLGHLKPYVDAATRTDIESATAVLTAIKESPADKKKQIQKDRLEAAMQLVIDTTSTTLKEADAVSRFASALRDEEWKKFRAGLIRNSLRPDLHFLPKDGHESYEWRAVPVHSVVLFRYPYSLPVRLLDEANHLSIDSWEQRISSSGLSPILWEATRNKPPLKCLRLKKDFLADLLSRFVSLFSRLGSPDFTDEAITEMSDQLDPRSEAK